MVIKYSFFERFYLAIGFTNTKTVYILYTTEGNFQWYFFLKGDLHHEFFSRLGSFNVSCY